MRREVVTLDSYQEVLDLLSKETLVAVDTETTGLRPYKTDVLFGLVLASECGTFYFHFDENDGVEPRFIIDTEDVWASLREFFKAQDKTWAMHHATFDLSFLAKEGIFLSGKIHDTKTIARLHWNNHISYSLKDCAKRSVGLDKSSSVERYIAENGLFGFEESPHKKDKAKLLYFHKVPFDIISEYTLQDGHITYELAKEQLRFVDSYREVYDLECALVPAVFSMEQAGVKIDRKYCLGAIESEESRALKLTSNFKSITGQDFIDSNKLFREIFNGIDVPKTEMGNPSFDRDSLLRLSGNPVADTIREYRDAKKQVDYFHGFLYYADNLDVVHTNLTRDGTVSGRFSSSSPNFQNLSRTDDGDGFDVKGALVPRDGFTFYNFDFVGQELRLMLDLAGAKNLSSKILAGEDPHQATADLVGISRQAAKTLNFALIYSAGPQRISEMLKIDLLSAKKLRSDYFAALPEVSAFIKGTIRDAEILKEIKTWKGRILRFPAREDCYRAPNHRIQGGAADIMKTAIVGCFNFLSGYRSRAVLTVHDSLVFEIADGEEHLLPTIKKIMISSYPHKILSMDVSVERAARNLAEVERVLI